MVGLPVRARRWVRLNPGSTGQDHLRQIWSSHLKGIVLPKVDDPQDIDAVAATLGELDSPGSGDKVEIVVIIETARALREVDRIATHPRISSLQLGELDLAADLGCHPSADETEMLFARSRVVAASAAAGLEPPVGSVSPDYSDPRSFRDDSERLRRLGFAGRATIHPAQVTVANEVISPAPEDLQTAQHVLNTYAEAISRGEGVVRSHDETMIDEALARASQRVVTLARSLDSDALQGTHQ